jgi:hypothetical protein
VPTRGVAWRRGRRPRRACVARRDCRAARQQADVVLLPALPPLQRARAGEIGLVELLSAACCAIPAAPAWRMSTKGRLGVASPAVLWARVARRSTGTRGEAPTSAPTALPGRRDDRARPRTNREVPTRCRWARQRARRNRGFFTAPSPAPPRCPKKKAHRGTAEQRIVELEVDRGQRRLSLPGEARHCIEAAHEPLVCSPARPVRRRHWTRRSAHTIRLALTYPLLDRSHTIGRPHLEAALALWRYVRDSTRWFFGDTVGDPSDPEGAERGGHARHDRAQVDDREARSPAGRATRSVGGAHEWAQRRRRRKLERQRLEYRALAGDVFAYLPVRRDSRDRAATRRGNEICIAHGFEATAGAPPNRRPLNPSPAARRPQRPTSTAPPTQRSPAPTTKRDPPPWPDDESLERS